MGNHWNSVIELSFSGLSAASTKTVGQVADSVYIGGSILTMEGENPTYAEATSVKDGKILSIGKKTDVLKDKGEHTRLVDLQNKLLLPGFIDAHGHAWTTGFQKLSANLLPPPDGGESIPALIDALKTLAGKKRCCYR